MPYLSASELMIQEEPLYQVYVQVRAGSDLSYLCRVFLSRVFIISAKEVMFSLVSVCLSVCLSVNRITQKLLIISV